MEIKVRIKEKNKLELLEDAKAGDIINLNSITSIDQEIITSKIEEAFKERLKKEIDTAVLKTKMEIQEKINNYENKVVILNKEKEDIKKITITELKSINDLEKQEIENNYKLNENNLNNTINNLKEELKDIKTKVEDELNLKFNIELSKVKEDSIKEVTKLEKEKDLLINDKKQFEELFKLKLEKEVNDKENKLTLKFNEELSKKEKEISNLINQRAVKNVKQTGEDLEAWCESEVKTYMQNGLFNCTWNKDNIVVKEENDIKGSKADFIFNIFSNDNHEVLLTNICLEMKDENPDSIVRKKNDDHYKQLDKNRTKKGCKYALLVSNLELDKPNDLPMYRVLEYKDMYVVRPAYLMTFLNMIVSLSIKFKDLLLNIEKEKIEFKSSNDLLDEFDALKKRYLDNPLSVLEKDITSIKSASSAIITSAEKINKLCDDVKIKYIEEIQNKLSRFNINKISKKL